ncbi:hypothetical protein B0H17DRAFT_1069418 [Mycena rosella]|uniref:F-box domain-containing protein n=1 Tax=Mycena rosella TaxID=1033263 RepID=A0AAD7DBL8_MYCRO|nr:hypothetical protein B0H17DRAFT_1069418 [Mycena rosella]
MASIHSVLSPDLILEILDCLAIPFTFHQRSCDLPVLAACSTVCKAWSTHAQRLLFRRVILPHNIYREPHLRATSRNSLPSFLAAIDPVTERGRWLAESVISLTVRHTGRAPTSDPTALATALLRTPNLRHLDVTTISCDFDSDSLARLRESGPRITSLCILQDFSPFEAQHTRIMHQLVGAFPTIRLLEITADLTSALPPFDPPLRLALAAVKFNTAFVPDIAPCLASLVDPDSEAHLEFLWHKSKTRPSALEEVLSAHGANLRALSLKTVDAGQATELAHCTQLERFELGRFPDGATLALIPRSVTALVIAGAPAPGELDGLVEQLASFPALKTLTWSSCQDPSLFRSLVTICTERGIFLRAAAAAAELTDDNAVEMELRRRYIRI